MPKDTQPVVEDIQAIVDAQSQIDPSFKSSRLYSRLSAAQVRQQLILQKGYQDEELPGEETIRQRLNELGYHLRRVAKIKPKKRNSPDSFLREKSIV